jgi:hypothetical protein
MSYNNQPQNDGYVIELPFKCHVGDKPETVANRFTGEKVELQPDAVAVYDTIIGAERFGMWDTVRSGQDWFRMHYPIEYMILLD